MKLKASKLVLKRSNILKLLGGWKYKNRSNKFIEKETEKQLEDLVFDHNWSEGFQEYIRKEGKAMDKFHRKINEWYLLPLTLIES